MNKKGFTITELIVSFALISVISIILFNIILSLKELYVSGDIKTSLLNKQGILTRTIYNDLDNKKLNSIRACGVTCLTFEYEKDGKKELKNLLVDVAGNTIVYGNYTMKLSNGSKVVSESDNPVDFKYTNSVLYLNIPIKTSLLDDDFGIRIVKKVNDVNIDKTIKFSDANIIVNKIYLDINKINFAPEYFTENASFEPNYTISNQYAIFAKIFHQDKLDSENNPVYFKDYDEFIYSNNKYKLSALNSLEIFRSVDKTTSIINSLSSEEPNIKKSLEKEYKNGYFELILDYPGYNGSSFLQNYNWFSQTSNFTTSDTLKNKFNFNSTYTGQTGGKWINGLKLIDNNNYFVTGTDNGNYFNIGSKSNADLVGPTGLVDSVDLWVRIDEYINKYSLCTFDDLSNNIIIKYSDNGVIIDTVATVSGEKLELPILNKKGYNFLGWYTEESGGEVVDNTTIFDTSTTIYAHFS